MKKFSEIINPPVIIEQKFVSVEEQIFEELGSRIKSSALNLTRGAILAGVASAPIIGAAYLGSKLIPKQPPPQQGTSWQMVPAPVLTKPKTSDEDESKSKIKEKTPEELNQERKSLFAKTLTYGEHRNSSAEREMRAHDQGYSAKSYIRTGGKASAWGPLQVTETLFRDLRDNHSELIPKGLEGHLDSMISQGQMFRKHVDGKIKDQKYGPRGTGHLFPHGDDVKGLDFHNNVYMPIAHALIDVKMKYWQKANKEKTFDWNNPEHVHDLAARWRGRALEPEYKTRLNAEMFPGK